MARFTLFIFALLLHPLTAQGAGSVVVDSLLMPAWVERGNSRIALMPGMQLKTNDQVHTGKNGKILLKLEEGSDVKLGENVELAIESVEPAAASADSIFSSTLNVLRGAFRFTTTFMGQDLRRNINIRVGAVTAGVRGTDLWGKSTDDRNFVVLLEGEIDLMREGDAVVRMDNPMTIYQAPVGQPSKPVEPVDQNALALWAQETELDSGKGVITQGGKQIVYLASYHSRNGAEKARDQFQHQGYAVELFPAVISGNDWFRIGIKGFASRADADYFGRASSERLGTSGAWVDKI